MDAEAMRRVRGARIAMVFQEPMTSLNPVFSIGDQIASAVLAHGGTSRQRGVGAHGRDARPGPDSRRRASGRATTRTSSPAGCASAP